MKIAGGLLIGGERTCKRRELGCLEKPGGLKPPATQAMKIWEQQAVNQEGAYLVAEVD